MAEPTTDDIRNACKYAEAKIREELGFNEYIFLPKKYVTFRRHRERTYPCPFDDSKLCPTDGRYVFTRAGCEEMSCNPYGPGGMTLSRANRGSFGKYCYLDDVSMPSYYASSSSSAPSNQTAGEGESASAADKKKANEDEGDDDDGDGEEENPSQPAATTPVKKKKAEKKNKNKKKRSKAGDAPSTHIHAWARLPGATDYGCYVASPYVYATAHVMGLGLAANPPAGAPKSAVDEYERVFGWYNESGKIPHGMPLLHYTKDYCEKKVYVSYDDESMQCYRPPGQYVAEEAFMGKIYREILISVRGTT